MRRITLAATLAALVAAAGSSAAPEKDTKTTSVYKLEEGTVLEYETSATFTSMRGSGTESWHHKASFTVLAARNGEYDVFVKITPDVATSKSPITYACDTIQLAEDGKIVKQGQLLPSAIFPGWSLNYELPQIYEAGENVSYRDTMTMLPLQAKVTHTKTDGVLVQKIIADPKSKILEQIPVKIHVLEVENKFSTSEGIPVSTTAQFAAELQVSEDGQKRAVSVNSEAKFIKKSSLPKDALAKLKDDVAMGVNTFKTLRETTSQEDLDTTAIIKAIDDYLTKFPEGEFAPLLKELRTKVMASRERAQNWAMIREGNLAPTFSTKAIDGALIDLAKLRGKVVVLDFWATWCGPCRQMLPKMKEFYQEFKDKDFVMVGISGDDALDTLKEFVEKEEVAWPQIFEGDGGTTTVLYKYGITKFPTLVVVDKHGVIRGVDVHPPELNDLVKKLVEEKQ